MKKDRVVGLCICVALLGNMQIQQMTGLTLFPIPSLPEVTWGLITGQSFGLEAITQNSGTLKRTNRAAFISTVLHTGWPALSFVYDETVRLRSIIRTAQVSRPPGKLD